MKIVLGLLWGFVGLCAVVALFRPQTVMDGLLPLVVPGLILAVMPTIFIYGSLIIVLRIGFQKINLRWPGFLATALVIGAGVGLAMSWNAPVEKKVAELIADDVDFPGEFGLSETLALLDEEAADTTCREICQRLLYSGTVKTVLVGKGIDDPAKATGGEMLAAYSVFKQDGCPLINHTKDEYTFPKNGMLRPDIAQKCLTMNEAMLASAGMVLSERHVLRGVVADDHPWGMPLATLSARRLELLRKDAAGYTPLYRATRARSNPLTMPLTVGPDVVGQLKVRTGWMHTDKFHNGGSSDYYDFGPETRKLLGIVVGK